MSTGLQPFQNYEAFIFSQNFEAFLFKKRASHMNMAKLWLSLT